MSSDLKLRRAQESDLSAIVELEIHLGLPRWGEAGYRRQLDEDTGILIVATTGAERVAGFANARVVADEMELLAIGVGTEFRRFGLGLDLLRATEEVAMSAGAMRSFLEVRASNAAAIRLYEKRGYVRSGIRKAYYEEPVEDALMMERVLA